VPIYEYRCQDCAYTFELKQSMKAEAVATCERCGKSVCRIISAPAIMFKGTGWYVTDYSDKMKPPTGESSNEPAEKKKETPASEASAPVTAGAPAAPAAAPSSASTSAPTTSSPAATSTSGSSTGST
jgi:putative FmdB family regulatory protein